MESKIEKKSDVQLQKSRSYDSIKKMSRALFHEYSETIQSFRKIFAELKESASPSFKEAFSKQQDTPAQSASEDATDSREIADDLLALLRDSFVKANRQLEKDLYWARLKSEAFSDSDDSMLKNDQTEYDQFIKEQNQIFHELIAIKKQDDMLATINREKKETDSLLSTIETAMQEEGKKVLKQLQDALEDEHDLPDRKQVGQRQLSDYKKKLAKKDLKDTDRKDLQEQHDEFKRMLDCLDKCSPLLTAEKDYLKLQYNFLEIEQDFLSKQNELQSQNSENTNQQIEQLTKKQSLAKEYRFCCQKWSTALNLERALHERLLGLVPPEQRDPEEAPLNPLEKQLQILKKYYDELRTLKICIEELQHVQKDEGPNRESKQSAQERIVTTHKRKLESMEILQGRLMDLQRQNDRFSSKTDEELENIARSGIDIQSVRQFIEDAQNNCITFQEQIIDRYGIPEEKDFEKLRKWGDNMAGVLKRLGKNSLANDQWWCDTLGKQIGALAELQKVGLSERQRRNLQGRLWATEKCVIFLNNLNQSDLAKNKATFKASFDLASALEQLWNFDLMEEKLQDKELRRDLEESVTIMKEGDITAGELVMIPYSSYDRQRLRPHLKMYANAIEVWKEMRNQRKECNPLDEGYNRLKMRDQAVAKWIIAYKELFDPNVKALVESSGKRAANFWDQLNCLGMIYEKFDHLSPDSREGFLLGLESLEIEQRLFEKLWSECDKSQSDFQTPKELEERFAELRGILKVLFSSHFSDEGPQEISSPSEGPAQQKSLSQRDATNNDLDFARARAILRPVIDSETFNAVIGGIIWQYALREHSTDTEMVELLRDKAPFILKGDKIPPSLQSYFKQFLSTEQIDQNFIDEVKKAAAEVLGLEISDEAVALVKHIGVLEDAKNINKYRYERDQQEMNAVIDLLNQNDPTKPEIVSEPIAPDNNSSSSQENKLKNKLKKVFSSTSSSPDSKKLISTFKGMIDLRRSRKNRSDIDQAESSTAPKQRDLATDPLKPEEQDQLRARLEELKAWMRGLE